MLDKLKEYKILVIATILVIVSCIGILFYTKMEGEEKEASPLVPGLNGDTPNGENSETSVVTEKTISNTKSIDGTITEIEGNTFYIQSGNQEISKITLEDNMKIINYRTQKEISTKDIKIGDWMRFSKVYQVEDELHLLDNCDISVIRNLTGEDLKQELLSQEEVGMQIIAVENNKNNITLTCKITDYYQPDYEKAESFEIKVTVDSNSQIMASTENQLEQLQEIKNRGDTIYVRFRQEQKQKGNLVAENIEVMGC